MDEDRRRFLLGSATLAMLGTPGLSRQPEHAITYWAEVPAHAALCVLCVFMTDEPVEVKMTMAGRAHGVEARFDEHPFREHWWHNRSASPARVGIQATAQGGTRELPAMGVDVLSDRNFYVGFGYRPLPERVADRKGSYPYEAMAIGLIVYGHKHRR